MAWSAPRTWVAGETLTAALLNQELRDNLNAAFPVGSLHYFMQAATSVETTVNGFAVEANGVNLSRAGYAALNTKLAGLSYPFGSGDGSTTFGLPDLRGRALWAHATGSGHAQVNALGDTDGLALASRRPSDTVNISITLASHTHGSGGLSVTGSPGVTTTIVDDSFDTSPPLVTGVTAGTLDVGGATDSGGGGSDSDTDEALVAYAVAGTWFVKY